MMSPAERLARLNQMRDQIKELNEQISRLEAEDEGFVLHHQRSQANRRQPLSYADYVKFSTALPQYETAFARAGQA